MSQTPEKLQNELDTVRHELALLRSGVDVLIRERDELKQHVIRLAEELDAAYSTAEQARTELANTRRLLAANPGHFYSPIVDPDDSLVQRALTGQPAGSLPFSASTVLEWLERIVAHYETQPFPVERTEGRRFWLENPGFSYSDAITLQALVRELRPSRYIEVGSGYSSCAVMDLNDLLGGGIDATFIDPNPETLLNLLEGDDPYRSRIKRHRLQEVPLETFTALAENDVLFLDTSHVAKTASDVNDYLFRIFPALQPGVVVHVHDIFYPFEYLSQWVRDFKRSWNEIYFLRAFLTANPDWEVLFFNDWVYRVHPELIADRMPLCLRNRGGSLWMRKRSHAVPG